MQLVVPRKSKSSTTHDGEAVQSKVRDLVVSLHSAHPNDRESAAEMRRSFAQYGLRLEELIVSDEHFAAELRTLLSRHSADIFCLLSANYYGTRMDHAGTLFAQMREFPFVIFMHDHPVYFLDEYSAAPPGAIIFAPGIDSCDFILRYYSSKTQVIANTGSLPQVQAQPPSIKQFKGRRNEILCPMNLHVGGKNLDTLWHQLKQLPGARSKAALSLVDAALYETRVPLHMITPGPYMSDSADETSTYLRDQLHVLNFLKIWRRTEMIRSLMHLPILISSEVVPADLQRKHPAKFTMLSVKQTIPLYSNVRFALNSHPLITAQLHDRVVHALHANAVVISDANSAVYDMFRDEFDMLFFDFKGVETVNKITRYLDHPDLAYALTEKAYDTRIRYDASLSRGYAELVGLVQKHWSRAEVSKKCML